MKRIFLLILFLTTLSTTSCVDSGEVERVQSQVEELESEKQELQSKVDELEAGIREAEGHFSDLKSKIDELEDDVHSLKSYVANFGFMNWKAVVLDVESQTRRVSSSLDDVQSTASDLESDFSYIP